MVRLTRTPIAAGIAAALLAALTACGGGTSTSSGGSSHAKTLTYWASNQGSSIQDDYHKLGPQLQKFQQQTGIKVKLEVVGWPDLLNRILAATTSGRGPDLVNIGNTWSASLQSTGAFVPFTATTFNRIGGENRFLRSAIGSTGAAGKPPTAVPLYSLAYGLYYNKKLFAKQPGADFFDASGNPTFTTPGAVQGVTQFVNLMATDKIVAPADAEYDQNQSVSDFATGKAAMLMWQAAGSTLKAHGMTPSQYGVAPVPVQSGTPGPGDIDSMVAGINIAIFKNTGNLSGALKFVKFMTSDAEQKTLNGEYGGIPPVKSALSDPAFSTPELTVLRSVLANSAAALPQVPKESQFEQLVGTAMKNLFADAAAGRPVTAQTVKQQLASAQQQMG